jgi:hypothetical protein
VDGRASENFKLVKGGTSQWWVTVPVPPIRWRADVTTDAEDVDVTTDAEDVADADTEPWASLYDDRKLRRIARVGLRVVMAYRLRTDLTGPLRAFAALYDEPDKEG